LQNRTLLEGIRTSGVAFHHSSLSTHDRQRVEQGFRMKIINVICCTTTLAAGVNLPARRVILSTLTVGNNVDIKSRQYRQICGRAGRAGLDAMGEAFVVAGTAERERAIALMTEQLAPVMSAFLPSLPRPSAMPGTAAVTNTTTPEKKNGGKSSPGIHGKLSITLERVVLDAVGLEIAQTVRLSHLCFSFVIAPPIRRLTFAFEYRCILYRGTSWVSSCRVRFWVGLLTWMENRQQLLRHTNKTLPNWYLYVSAIW
jgi:hypothetical protein